MNRNDICLGSYLQLVPAATYRNNGSLLISVADYNRLLLLTGEARSSLKTPDISLYLHNPGVGSSAFTVLIKLADTHTQPHTHLHAFLWRFETPAHRWSSAAHIVFPLCMLTLCECAVCNCERVPHFASLHNRLPLLIMHAHFKAAVQMMTMRKMDEGLLRSIRITHRLLKNC